MVIVIFLFAIALPPLLSIMSEETVKDVSIILLHLKEEETKAAILSPPWEALHYIMMNFKRTGEGSTYEKEDKASDVRSLCPCPSQFPSSGWKYCCLGGVQVGCLCLFNHVQKAKRCSCCFKSRPCIIHLQMGFISYAGRTQDRLPIKALLSQSLCLFHILFVLNFGIFVLNCLPI